ncbi:MAG: hypothetical protein WCS70_15150 [Verrucomicrobiota bacterium]
MRRRNERGSTLVFTLSILGLLAALAAVLVAPPQMAARRVDLYYRKLQARELSVAGVELARTWGVATNAEVALGNGTVVIGVRKVAAGQWRLESTGRVAGPKVPVEQQTEMTVTGP